MNRTATNHNDPEKNVKNAAEKAPLGSHGNPIVIDPDDGWLDLTLRSADGEEREYRLDVLRVNNTIAELAELHQNETERGDALVKWLAADQGLPPVSHAVADKIASACVAEVRRLYGAPAAPPAPTAG